MIISSFLEQKKTKLKQNGRKISNTLKVKNVRKDILPLTKLETKISAQANSKIFKKYQKSCSLQVKQLSFPQSWTSFNLTHFVTLVKDDWSVKVVPAPVEQLLQSGLVLPSALGLPDQRRVGGVHHTLPHVPVHGGVDFGIFHLEKRIGGNK